MTAAADGRIAAELPGSGWIGYPARSDRHPEGG
jgi:hypothetical protein